jgi:hypothetical protein
MQMLYYSKREEATKKKERTRYDVLGRFTPEEKTQQLLRRDPAWGPILRACLFVSSQHKERFAGAWVFQNLRAEGNTGPNNLRTLSALGLLKISATTRHGNRAYYTMPTAKAIAKALKDIGY